MTINPLNLLKLKEKYRVFKEEHPEMPKFGKLLNKKALIKGSIMSIRVTTPEGDVIKHEFELTENDVEMVRLFVGE